jgi:hypothetical protein
MQLKAYWAYDFACDLSLEIIEAAFAQASPWRWELRDSAVYGEYLNARPIKGVRVRVHEYPQTGETGTFLGLCKKGFSALLEIGADSSATKEEVDRIFRGLLCGVKAMHVTAIEPYD